MQHKTNGYDFPLITVLVIDEFGEGYPAAWCISNKEDTNVLIIFFERLKTLFGNVKALFMAQQLTLHNNITQHGQLFLALVAKNYYARGMFIMDGDGN